jgi:transposase
MVDRYLGLDGHSQSCTLAVMGPSGKRLKSMVVETNGRALVEAVRSIPGRLHLCIEEGELSAWLCELLSPHVYELVVTVPKSTKGQPKDDLRDAWTRAEEIRIGSFNKRVYKPPLHLTPLRNAVRAYGMAIQDVTRVKCRLKSVLRSRGIAVDSSVYRPASRERWLQQLPPAHQPLAQWLGEELDQLVPLRDKAEQWLLKEAKTHPIIRKLETAPGMGPVRTAQLVAVVANPHRFRTTRQFWSYCGLGIVTHSSSDWVRDKKAGRWIRDQVQQTRGLTRERHPLLKSVMKGAATTVIRMPAHPLQLEYHRRLEAGIKPNLAKLTLARRIAAIVLSMWKHQEVYDPKRHEAVPATT